MQSKNEAVDVVIATKGEWTLPYCVKSVREAMKINQLIIVAPTKVVENVANLATIVIPFDERNVGKARAEGLKFVETPKYASIDSDVLVTREWFNWCTKTIRTDGVAACQGYAKPVGKYYPVIQEKWIRNEGGMYGKGFCDLGNTMLNTEIIQNIGIPLLAVGEDWALRLKLERAGYKWVSNIDLACQHLKTDVDVWHRAAWWGSISENVDLLLALKRISIYLTVGMRQRPIRENLFLVGEQLSTILGKLV